MFVPCGRSTRKAVIGSRCFNGVPTSELVGRGNVVCFGVSKLCHSGLKLPTSQTASVYKDCSSSGNMLAVL